MYHVSGFVTLETAGCVFLVTSTICVQYFLFSLLMIDSKLFHWLLWLKFYWVFYRRNW